MNPGELSVISLLKGRIILRRAEFYIRIRAIPRANKAIVVIIPF
jgi:hypothetical protein